MQDFSDQDRYAMGQLMGKGDAHIIVDALAGFARTNYQAAMEFDEIESISDEIAEGLRERAERADALRRAMLANHPEMQIERAYRQRGGTRLGERK
ncbi:MAG: hypothetical protein GY737_00025 [Desulfobacteraceae bacterium]|nr:hypothetical protein [Desulfobacteraceae bacterium]